MASAHCQLDKGGGSFRAAASRSRRNSRDGRQRGCRGTLDLSNGGATSLPPRVQNPSSTRSESAGPWSVCGICFGAASRSDRRPENVGGASPLLTSERSSVTPALPRQRVSRPWCGSTTIKAACRVGNGGTRGPVLTRDSDCADSIYRDASSIAVKSATKICVTSLPAVLTARLYASAFPSWLKTSAKGRGTRSLRTVL